MNEKLLIIITILSTTCTYLYKDTNTESLALRNYLEDHIENEAVPQKSVLEYTFKDVLEIFHPQPEVEGKLPGIGQYLKVLACYVIVSR